MHSVMRHVFLMLAMALAAGAPAWPASPAQEVAGIRLADKVNLGGQALVLNGAGLRRHMLMRIYVAALYLPERRHDTQAVLDGDGPRRLRLTLLRALTTDQNLDALKDGLEANNSDTELEVIRPRVEHFLALIRALREVPAGTVIELDYLPEEGTRVSVNDRPLGRVPGESFNRALLRIWLGEDPVQISLKRALLGRG